MSEQALEENASPPRMIVTSVMAGIVRIILSTVVVLCILSPPSHAYITVLLYHKFDEADSPSTSTPTAMFAQQMEYLHNEVP